MTQEIRKPRVALIATCLVDLFRPNIGFAAAKLIEDSGCIVEVPDAQTCCGQPAYNSGASQAARDIAAPLIAALEGFDYVVVPSGSCGGMIKHHYPQLFVDDPKWLIRAEAVAAKTHELVSFLFDIRRVPKVDESFDGTITYHDSCSGLREMGVRNQPRALLRQMDGLSLKELPDADVCCGFGGTFCVKYGEISDRIVSKKTAAIEASGAKTLLAGDLGCLMNMAGKLRRQGSSVQVRHVAEVLAGMAKGPAIGEGQ